MQRSELINYFSRVRKVSEDICRPLQTEDYVVQPVPDVSPPKWHLAHTTWFFEAMFLNKYISDYKPFHPLYNYVFNSYYQTFGDRWDRPRRGVLSRPTVKDVYEFRKVITDRMIALIDSVDENHWEEFSKLVVLALNHEQQHQELLISDIKYIFAQNPLYPIYDASLDYEAAVGLSTEIPSKFIPFEKGTYQIGYSDDGFCYDNEQPVHETFVNPFQLQNRLITNKEYLEFMNAGGYDDFRFWLSDGWDAKEKNNWRAPLHWEKIDNGWYKYTLHGLQKVNPLTPVCHMSYYEACAYANWAGKRLPTETEWEIAVKLDKASAKQGNFYDDKFLHPMGIAKTKSNNNKLFQMLGDVWEWTNSAYLPYPGYRQEEGALGEYNGKFMINQMVLKGGSCATSRDHIRITYRNFFQPDKRWQFSGFRLANEIK